MTLFFIQIFKHQHQYHWGLHYKRVNTISLGESIIVYLIIVIIIDINVRLIINDVSKAKIKNIVKRKYNHNILNFKSKKICRRPLSVLCTLES